MAGGVGVMAFDFGRRLARCDPVVELTGGFGFPACTVLAEFSTADGGVVPQKTVACGGYDERNGRLRIAVRQFEGAAFEVHIRLLVLPHTVEMLGFACLEERFDFLATAIRRAVVARVEFQRSVLRQFTEELDSVRRGEAEFAQAFRMARARVAFAEHVGRHHKVAVGQGRDAGAFVDGHFDRILGLMVFVEQTPIHVIDGHLLRGPDPHAIRTPGFDAQGFAFASPFECASVGFHSHGTPSFFIWLRCPYQPTSLLNRFT